MLKVNSGNILNQSNISCASIIQKHSESGWAQLYNCMIDELLQFKDFTRRL